MSDEEMKLRIIDIIVNMKDEELINALYEVIVNGDLDYVENLFDSKEDFEEFIEKWEPNKCCEWEDND